MATDDILLGSELRARYEPLVELGRGAMGVVWKATRRADGRAVALKVVRDQGFAEVSERLAREHELLTRLKHPRVMELFGVGKDGSHTYLVLELVEGGTLADRLEKGPLTPAQAVEIACEVLEGVAHCHDAGVIHRDLKPDNLLFDAAGHVKIADLGMARAVDSRTLTAPGIVVGTPRYMAPEVLRGEKAGPAADVYAVGAILFEMLEGKPPFHSEELLGLCKQILVEPAPAIARAGVPRSLRELVQHALAKEPADRPASARAFAERLAAAGSDDKPDVENPNRTVRITRTTRPFTSAVPVVGARAPERIRGYPGWLVPACVMFALAALATPLMHVVMDARRKPQPSPPAVASPVWAAPEGAAQVLAELEQRADQQRWHRDQIALDDLLTLTELDNLRAKAREVRLDHDRMLRRARELDATLTPPPGHRDDVDRVLRARVAGLVACLVFRTHHLEERIAASKRGLGFAATSDGAYTESEIVELERGVHHVAEGLLTLAGVRPLTPALEELLAALERLANLNREFARTPVYEARGNAAAEALFTALRLQSDPEARAFADAARAVWAMSPSTRGDPARRPVFVDGVAALRRLVALASPQLVPPLDARRAWMASQAGVD